MIGKMALFLACLLLAVSCVSNLSEQELPQTEMTENKYSITVEMELPQLAAASRSSYPDELLNRITDLNIFIYHDGCLLEEHSEYFSDISSLMLSFPFEKNGFNIYMIGNVGRVDPPEDESDIVDLCCAYEGYDDFREKGFPVANVFPDYMKGTFASFRLKRLVGQYNISLQPSAVDARYFIKDLRLMNCALDVYPFGYQKKASKFVYGGTYGEDAVADYLTEEDIARLNRGEQVSICFLENLQGELLPGNKDRTKKIPSALEALQKGLSECCTYMEITADIVTPSAKYTDAKYRFYLGQNETTDFSIVRNTLYNVTLDFTQNMVSEQEWRIEVNEPLVNALTLSKDVADVVRGIDDVILIYGPKMKINTGASDKSDPRYCSYVLEDAVVGGVDCQKLTFHTEAQLEGFYSWGADYKTMANRCIVRLESVEKYNGSPLITKDITARIHNNAFPVFIRIGTNDSGSPYQLEALSDAPVNFGFSVSANMSAEVVSESGSGEYTYKTSASKMSTSSEGYRCCVAGFPGLYNNFGTVDEKVVYFRNLEVKLEGLLTDCNKVERFYMGEGGEAYWGPGATYAPQRFRDLEEDADVMAVYTHSCAVPGCVRYEVTSAGVPLFVMTPAGRSCSTVSTTGTSNSLSYDFNEYNSGDYMPFYIVNGGLKYSYPVTLLNDEAKYLDDSGRKSIIFQMYGPGRDVFYPNGAVWGDVSDLSPSPVHSFGYTAGLVKQFFGNIHTWQIYQDYDCEFYMTINGCTAWPGASNSDVGFRLAYDL